MVQVCSSAHGRSAWQYCLLLLGNRYPFSVHSWTLYLLTLNISCRESGRGIKEGLTDHKLLSLPCIIGRFLAALLCNISVRMYARLPCNAASVLAAMQL